MADYEFKTKLSTKKGRCIVELADALLDDRIVIDIKRVVSQHLLGDDLDALCSGLSSETNYRFTVEIEHQNGTVYRGVV